MTFLRRSLGNRKTGSPLGDSSRGPNAWLDTEVFYSIVQLRANELDVISAMQPGHAHLISVDDVSGSVGERRDIEQGLWQSYSYEGLERISKWLWSLYQNPNWGRATRLTVPLLMLDELLIHRLHCRPYEQGELNIHEGIYPVPMLFDRFDGPADVERWTSKNFDLGPTLRLVDGTDRDTPPLSGVVQSGNPSRPHERRFVTPTPGNPATISLYQDIYEVVGGLLPTAIMTDIVAQSTLKWYFLNHSHPLTLEAARPIVLGHARREALAELAGPNRAFPAELLVDQFTQPDLGGSADAEVDRVDRRLSVIQSLQLLSSEEAGALVLRYCYDLPFEKLAYLMDCDVPTIRQVVARAMKTFVANLESA